MCSIYLYGKTWFYISNHEKAAARAINDQMSVTDFQTVRQNNGLVSEILLRLRFSAVALKSILNSEGIQNINVQMIAFYN